MAITNSQQARQMYNRGGLSAPRQNYGLGKLVKKAFRGVKKIAKSPLGKAALIGGLGYGLNAGMFGGIGKGFITGKNAGLLTRLKSGEGFLGKTANLFRNKGVGDELGTFNMGKLGLGALAAGAVALPFMGGGGDDEVEEVGEVMDPRYQVQRAKNFYSGLGNKGAGLDFMPKKKYVDQNFYAADGGRAGYAGGGYLDEDEEEFIRSGAGQRRIMPQTFLAMGGGAGEAQAEQMLQAEFIKYKNKGGELSFQEFVQAVMQQQQQAQGMEQPMMAANGGRMNAAEGGIMDTEQSEMIDMGGQEKDYRDEGGFVAMGGEERADDVPARLSKNEFVFTADAVRAAGGGDIDQGSEVMQNMMDNLEQGGQISEGSQGLGGGEEIMSEEMIEEPDGAQAMYEQQQMLQSRMA